MQQSGANLGAYWARAEHSLRERHKTAATATQIFCHIGGYARASYASGGGGASRVPRIAGDVTAGPALVSCVPVSYALCAERRRF